MVWKILIVVTFIVACWAACCAKCNTDTLVALIKYLLEKEVGDGADNRDTKEV